MVPLSFRNLSSGSRTGRFFQVYSSESNFAGARGNVYGRSLDEICLEGNFRAWLIETKFQKRYRYARQLRFRTAIIITRVLKTGMMRASCILPDSRIFDCTQLIWRCSLIFFSPTAKSPFFETSCRGCLCQMSNNRPGTRYLLPVTADCQAPPDFPPFALHG